MNTRTQFPRCIITGCKLILTNVGEIVHGDLHKVGGTYVFNAAVSMAGAEMTVSKELGDWKKLFDGQRNVIAVDSNFVFEKRGVYVFAASAATLNRAALDYTKDAA